MPKLKIEGKKELSGEVIISGAKNSAVALIPAAILSRGKSKIYNVPSITDIDYLIKILKLLNCNVDFNKDYMEIDSTNLIYSKIPEELSVQMRASYYFMGALLAKFKKVEISFPGGCVIGSRPIDQHIKGFKALGAKVTMNHNDYIIEAKELIGDKVYLDIASVGATINIMMAALGAKGTTIIENAAREPEIVNLASFLISMGASIKGAGTTKITIEGNKDLNNGIIEVFPDRIEAGTYIIMGALLGNNLKIKNIIKEHIQSLLIKLEEVGVDLSIDTDTITISKCNNIKPTYIKTLVYPGFPTDLQQPFTTLLTQANGTSYIEETIYESRFRNSIYLNYLGAKTKILNDFMLEIKGTSDLKGCEVSATDLRGGASLLIAALIAEGTTTIDEIDCILRGYGDIVNKLTNIGAKIKLID